MVMGTQSLSGNITKFITNSSIRESPVRLFIATKLTEKIYEMLDDLIQSLSSPIGSRNVKWISPSGIHLTLKFLGDTPEGKIIQIQHVMDEIIHGISPFPISIQGVGCFPNCRSPRVIWVGVKETQGILQDLQLRLENGLTNLNFPREKRTYHPHLTIGRVRRHVGNSDRRAIGGELNHIGQTDIGTQMFNEISLIRSDLKPSGAVYSHVYSSSFKNEDSDLEK